jgi:hypothetical protein
MSYAITPQKDPLLDESSRPIDRRKAAIGAALFTILLVLSVFLRFFSKQDPVPEPQGLITSFESIEIEPGGGGGSPSNSEEPEPKNETSSSKAKEVETNDDIKSSTSVKTTKNNDSNAKVDAGLDFGNFKGDNKTNSSSSNTNGSNNLGQTNGRGDGNGYGDGNEDGPGSGLCIRNCTCNNNKWEIDIVEVTAYITVDINENGNVDNAYFAKKGDVKGGKDYTSMNTNINAQKSSTKKIVLDCFRGRTYKSTGKKYRVTQKMVLKKI